jgi:hypothetical protein
MCFLPARDGLPNYSRRPTTRARPGAPQWEPERKDSSPPRVPRTCGAYDQTALTRRRHRACVQRMRGASAGSTLPQLFNSVARTVPTAHRLAPRVDRVCCAVTVGMQRTARAAQCFCLNEDNVPMRSSKPRPPRLYSARCRPSHHGNHRGGKRRQPGRSQLPPCAVGVSDRMCRPPASADPARRDLPDLPSLR